MGLHTDKIKKEYCMIIVKPISLSYRSESEFKNNYNNIIVR